MKNKLLKILLYSLLLIVTVLYTYKFRVLVDDELFNYGFAKNIIDGLIPYKDFNMIIPPVFAYITALILKLFGQKLIIYHILTAIIILGITNIIEKKIGKLSLLIYLLLLIYPYTGYNIFALILFFILLTYLDNNKVENKKIKDYIEPIIISLIILTKHTLGLLVIPSLIYSKNKLKTFIVYIISFLILIIYLLINKSLPEFFNYTILGMFDFAGNNKTSINFLFIIELIIIGILIYKLKKTKKKEYFYVLMFQIVSFPIANYIHFIISFIPFIYLIIKEYNKLPYFKWFITIVIVTFFIAINIIFYTKSNEMTLTTKSINNFIEGRTNYNIIVNDIKLIKENIEKYNEHKLYIFSNWSYQIKLNLEIPITKYDIINNGNMGYKGSEKYIKEVDKYCEKEKCLLIINMQELMENNFQTNKDILKYVTKNYQQIYSSNTINIYKN